MALYTTVHLHDVPAEQIEDYAKSFEGPHRKTLNQLRGLRFADWFEVTIEQIMQGVPQPWRYMSVYEFDLPNPAIDLPALAPLIAEARDQGLIASDGT